MFTPRIDTRGNEYRKYVKELAFRAIGLSVDAFT